MLCTAYAENLAHGTVLAGRADEAKGQILIITDDVKITWKGLMDRFADALGAPRIRYRIPKLLARLSADVVETAWTTFNIKRPPPLTRYRVGITLKDFHFTCDKAKDLLGYAPKVGMDQAVRRTAAWYLADAPMAQ